MNVEKTPIGGPYLHHVCSVTVPHIPGGTDITPEDLIVAFGHCQVTAGALGACPLGGKFDNDHNGYANDINGWNFNRDNNDPQTEQSIYAHFTGESAQLVCPGRQQFSAVSGSARIAATSQLRPVTRPSTDPTGWPKLLPSPPIRG